MRISRSFQPIAALNRALEAAIRRTGVTDVSWHNLRKTSATRLLGRGAAITDVQHLLGHASVKTTEKADAACVKNERFKQAIDSLNMPLLRRLKFVRESLRRLLVQRYDPIREGTEPDNCQFTTDVYNHSCPHTRPRPGIPDPPVELPVTPNKHRHRIQTTVKLCLTRFSVDCTMYIAWQREPNEFLRTTAKYLKVKWIRFRYLVSGTRSVL